MRGDFHSGDPRLIWQNQPTEESKVSSIVIRQKARDLHAKTRRQMLGTLTVPLVVAFFYAFSVKQFPDLRYALHLLFAFTLAWSVAGLYFLNRENRSGTLPADVGFSTGLEFCRREIERRRNYFRHDLLWSFGARAAGHRNIRYGNRGRCWPCHLLKGCAPSVARSCVDSCVLVHEGSAAAGAAARAQRFERDRERKRPLEAYRGRQLGGLGDARRQASAQCGEIGGDVHGLHLAQIG